MKWVVLSTQYAELYIHGRALKVRHVLSRVSDPLLVFLFSVLGHERVSVKTRLPDEYTTEDYNKAVKKNNKELKARYVNTRKT